MKKFLLVLLFPLISFSQTYKDVMSISSVDMFKKVVIENGYEYDSTDNDWITYGYEIMRDYFPPGGQFFLKKSVNINLR